MWKIITPLFLLCALSLKAQNTLPLEWSKNPKFVNPGGRFTIAKMAFDETTSTNNALPIYIGNFSNTANFNYAEEPINGVFEEAESELDAFIAKYDENDVLLWVKKLHGTGVFTSEHLLVIDNFFYVLGTLSGTVDFNPTAGIANKTSAGDASLVIAKYDLNGFYVNAKIIDFDGDFEVQQFKTNGSLLAIIGEFNGNIDFGLSSNIESFGGNDGFIAMYNTNLSYQWASPIGNLGDDVASNIVFQDDYVFVSTVEQNILDPMCSPILPQETAYTGQYQLSTITPGRYGRLFDDGVIRLAGSGIYRTFQTTTLFPDIGGYPAIFLQMQLDQCGNLNIPKQTTGLSCDNINNIDIVSSNIENTYNIYNDSSLTLEFYEDVNQSCGDTPLVNKIKLTKIDAPVEDYNIDLSGNTPAPYTYTNYIRKYNSTNGTLVTSKTLGSAVNLSDGDPNYGNEDSKHYLHTNLHVANNNEIIAFAAYTGSKDFGNTTNLPPFAAPYPPARNTGDVISVFSATYNDLPNTNYFPYWQQHPESTSNMLKLNGDEMLQFNKMTYHGIQLENGNIDVSNMQYLHLDVWTKETVNQISTSLINNTNGVITENAVTTAITPNAWTSIDIPISDYTNQGLNVSQIWQLKFEANPSLQGTVFIDNIYFYKSAAAKPAEQKNLMPIKTNLNTLNTSNASSDVFSLPYTNQWTSNYFSHFLCKINPENVSITSVNPVLNNIFLYPQPQQTFLSAYEAATNSLILLNKTEIHNVWDVNNSNLDFTNYERVRDHYFFKINVDNPNNLSAKMVYNTKPPKDLFVNDAGIFQLIDNAFGYEDFDPRVNSTNKIEVSGYPIMNKYSLEGDYIASMPYNTGVRSTVPEYVNNALDANNNTYTIIKNTAALDINNDGLIDVPLNKTERNLSITKYNEVGQHLWTKALIADKGEIYVEKIKADYNNDLLIFGTFKGEAYFDPDTNTLTQSPIENDAFVFDHFIAKYNSNGTLLWLKTLKNNNSGGGIYFSNYNQDDLVIDSENNLYLSGGISSNETTIDIDTDPNFAHYVNLPVAGSYPLLTKIDHLGNIVFTKTGDPNMNYSNPRAGLAVNNNKLQYLFSDRSLDNENPVLVDVDLAEDSQVLVDAYRKEVLVNYSLDGEYLSHHVLKDMNQTDFYTSNYSSIFIGSPVVDAQNNLYTRSRHRNEFYGFNELDYQYSRVFIRKYDSNYNLLWEKSIGSSLGYAGKIETHESGKVFMNIRYGINAELTELSPNLFLTPSDQDDYGAAILVLNADGSLWGYKNYETSRAIHASVNSNKLNISGTYQNDLALDFESSNTNYTNNSIWEPFLVSYTLDDALSVLEDEFDINCKVYPSPFKHKVFIDVARFESATVHNIMGQKILDAKQQEIDLSGHKSGIYLVKVKTSQGKTFVRKVVKN